jgi:hypothetical protein
MTPSRFQVHRAKASKPNPDARCVCRPTRWGNPFDWRVHGRPEAVRLYREALLAGRLPFTCKDVLKYLQGRDLGCYCSPDDECHADVLLEVANADPR